MPRPRSRHAPIRSDSWWIWPATGLDGLPAVIPLQARLRDAGWVMPTITLAAVLMAAKPFVLA
jgi:hypothetical protein